MADQVLRQMAAEKGIRVSQNGRRSSDGPERPFTDAGNGELFADLYGEELKFDHRRGKWLRFRGHWWEPDADGYATRRAKELARARLRAATSMHDPDRQKVAVKWAFASESRARIQATLALATTEEPITDPGDSWDSDPWLLGVANGVVNLRTGELQSGKPGDRILLHSPVEYRPDARSDLWDKVVSAAFADDADKSAYFRRAVGYSITGSTAEQKVFAAYGGGSNAKGTLLNTIAAVLGGYSHNLPFSSLEVRRQESIPTDLADLPGKRFVTASETNEGVLLNAARFKALSGGDPITARHLHRDFFTFRPAAKLWLMLNHKPIVTDDSYAFWRRLALIPFLVTWVIDCPSPSPECTHSHADLQLDAKLWIERNGILAWLVRACLEYQREGLQAPPSIRMATDDYRLSSDKFTPFVEARLVPDATETSSTDLWIAYSAWADSEQIPQRERLTRSAFGRRLGERFQRDHRRRGAFYKGVRLRREGDPEDVWPHANARGREAGDGFSDPSQVQCDGFLPPAGFSQEQSDSREKTPQEHQTRHNSSRRTPEEIMAALQAACDEAGFPRDPSRETRP